MPNYLLGFKTHYYDGDIDSDDANTVERVIVAANKDVAEAVAHAMLGEEKWAHEELSRVFLVEETEREPMLENCDDGTVAWSRVLSRLGHKEEDVEFIVHQGEKVGFTLKQGA